MKSNLLFHERQHVGGCRAERLGQFEDDANGWLVDPAFDQADEISLHLCVKGELFLSQPGVFPKLP